MGDRAGNIEPILIAASGEQFFNTSKHDFKTLLAAPDDLADNLRQAASFYEHFGFEPIPGNPTRLVQKMSGIEAALNR